MKAGEARAAARRWVAAAAADDPHYLGAYFAGSSVDLPDDAELAPTSDVDVVVVDARRDPGLKLGKFRHDGALIEVTHRPASSLADADAVLSDYHLAGGFRTDSVIDDPTGQLSALHDRVRRDFADPRWVRRRCADVRRRIVGRLSTVDATAPWHDQVITWLFGTGVTAHLPLVAARRNPTVRLRYPAAHRALVDHGEAAAYPELLRQLVPADPGADRVRQHVGSLADTFAAAAAVARTPFFFSSDLIADARPIAIDGSLELVDRGEHQEAMFWIAVTFARCETVFAADAPHLSGGAPWHAVLLDLGIATTDDLRGRGAATLAYLPGLAGTADAMVDR